MANVNLQMQIDARRNMNESSTKYGRVYPVLYLKGQLSTNGLVKHMAEHGSLVTGEVLKLVLEQLKKCIPELCSQGYSVSLDGLGTFYPSIKADPQNGGCASVERFIEKDCNEMISGVFLRFKPTGDDIQKLTSKYYKMQCSFKKGDYVKVNIKTVEGVKQKWYERIPLENWEEYKAGGGTELPERDAQNP